MKKPEEIISDLSLQNRSDIKTEEVIEAMDKYGEEVSDFVSEMYMNAHAPLKPLEDIWRKEHPRNEYVIPDRKILCEWIASKILNNEKT